ncbi:MAG: hypothetical protein A2161_22735 [Candidatus Schekmanbacteria bacterium RBG_13_48_7]|uniref:Uncharacterized protein n=1 Tax=Candidatus Schekmanbacteria bacterium RBG_13_48_7 TaxID=1817878 RepID=A0A1F7S226_9BACT|nr:MAG: hypothetical protein A2161_22735 [Candidatus Schekmanbacteria bacterium RBG_13_48_7]
MQNHLKSDETDENLKKILNMVALPHDRIDFKKPIFKKSTKIRRGKRILNSDEILLIDKVINLFKEAKNENDNLMQQEGLSDDDVTVLDLIKIYIATLNEDQPKETVFRSYLESLSDDELALIDAVMYGGRDAYSFGGRTYPLDEMLEESRKNSREILIYTITSKGPLIEYLTAGINAYK